MTFFNLVLWTAILSHEYSDASSTDSNGLSESQKRRAHMPSSLHFIGMVHQKRSLLFWYSMFSYLAGANYASSHLVGAVWHLFDETKMPSERDASFTGFNLLCDILRWFIIGDSHCGSQAANVRSVPTKTYRESKESDDQKICHNTACAICLEDFETGESIKVTIWLKASKHNAKNWSM